MAKRDYYEVLGVGRNADEKEIKKSIQKTCQAVSSGYEPGRCEGRTGNLKRSQRLIMFSVTQKKKLYDQFG